MRFTPSRVGAVILASGLAVGLLGTTPATAATKSLVVDTVFQLKTTDPGRSYEQTGNMINRALYATLLTFKGGDLSKPVPDLAARYTASADAKTFTFVLNPKAVFNDGSKVTSADVVFSLNRLKNIKGNPSSLMNGLTVTATNPSTVVITSETPNVALPSIVASPSMGILNSKVLKANGGTDAADASTTDKAEEYLKTTSAGAGPYTLKSFSLTSQVVLDANPKYWGPKPVYKRVVFRNVPTNVQRLNVIKGASQVAIDLSPDQIAGAKNVNIVRGQASNVFFIYGSQNASFSPATKFTSNPKCIEAIRYGINYDVLVRYAGAGAIQAPGIIPSFFSGALKQSDRIRRDLARAKAAYTACGAGNTEIKIGYWSDGVVNGLSFGSLSALVAESLREVGFNIKLEGAPIAVSLPLYRDNKEELGLWLWGPDWPDSSNYTESFGPGKKVGLRMGWPAGSDPAIEALVTQASTTTDTAKRAQIYRNFQLEMNKRSPLIPLVQPAALIVTSKTVKGAQENAIWKINVAELK